MIRISVFAIFACLSLMISSCRRAGTHDLTSAPSPAPSADKSVPVLPNACALLSPAELESTVGEKLTQSTPTGSAHGKMAGAQCYFAMTTPANSVTLAVFQKSAGGRNPRELWNELFHREHDEAEDGKSEKGEKKSPPQLLTGLGDESFWIGSPVGGVLYTLVGNKYFRISVGGARDHDAKIKLSRQLAELVARRL